jgi:hypothetical protein
MESVSNVRYKQRAVIEFLVAEKESVRHVTNLSAMFMEVLRKAVSTAGLWAKRVTASETGKAELEDFRSQNLATY